MLELLKPQLDKLLQEGALLLSPAAVFSLPQLVAAFVIAVLFLAWRQKRRRGRVRPAVIWRALRATAGRLWHRSTRADIFYFLVNSFAIGGMIGWALLSSGAVATHTAHGLTAVFGTRHPADVPVWVLRAGLTLLAFCAYEFGYYVDHYCKHKIPFLWAFHQTHHSAEVLTPLTVFRVHPLDTLIFVNITSLCIGAAYGGFLWVVGRPVDLYLIGSANALTVLFLFLLAQLQHSQFWIPLRGLAGHLLLSPAHHQLHHSIDPQHYNCNLGSCLAIWDWMFGTLDVPAVRSPGLKFGVAQAAADPHRISTLLLAPLGNALAALWPKKP
jgi:sterol desaturase/sphingolipid hydroxylase (fatty acid hydroxylase superfamily)